MLTCIVRSKKLGDGSLTQIEESDSVNGPGNKQQSVKSLTGQVLRDQTPFLLVINFLFS